MATSKGSEQKDAAFGCRMSKSLDSAQLSCDCRASFKSNPYSQARLTAISKGRARGNSMKTGMRRICTLPIRCLAVVGLLAVAAYASYVGLAWCRYGQTNRTANDGSGDTHLESLIPVYDVVERLQVHVAAPAELTFSVACNLRLLRSGLIRAIFRTRRFVLGGTADENRQEMGLADQARAWGWSTLAEQPGREIVFGAVTQPWVANPVFRGLSPAEFCSFQEPGFVKIAWTLRADPIDPANSIASTETRVAATDAAARAKFRRYWAFVSPGTILIRLLALRRVRTEAERSEAIPLSGGIAR